VARGQEGQSTPAPTSSASAPASSPVARGQEGQSSPAGDASSSQAPSSPVARGQEGQSSNVDNRSSTANGSNSNGQGGAKSSGAKAPSAVSRGLNAVKLVHAGINKGHEHSGVAGGSAGGGVNAPTGQTKHLDD
jgi:hypothetical protein